MKCDYCGQPGIELAGETNDAVVCIDHARQVETADEAYDRLHGLDGNGAPCDDCKAKAKAAAREERLAGTTLPRMAKPSMEVNISFRVPRALRDAARAKAEERQENVSDVLRDALERYIKKK